jgi:hypothetical protein
MKSFVKNLKELLKYPSAVTGLSMIALLILLSINTLIRKRSNSGGAPNRIGTLLPNSPNPPGPIGSG